MRLCRRLALSVATLSPRLAARADARVREACDSLGGVCSRSTRTFEFPFVCAELEAAEDSTRDSESFSVVASVPLSSTISSPSSDWASSCCTAKQVERQGCT